MSRARRRQIDTTSASSSRAFLDGRLQKQVAPSAGGISRIRHRGVEPARKVETIDRSPTRGEKKGGPGLSAPLHHTCKVYHNKYICNLKTTSRTCWSLTKELLLILPCSLPLGKSETKERRGERHVARTCPAAAVAAATGQGLMTRSRAAEHPFPFFTCRAVLSQETPPLFTTYLVPGSTQKALGGFAFSSCGRRVIAIQQDML